jgi:hypothetical protein
MESISSSEKYFIEFLTLYIVQTSPGDLQGNLNKVADHLQKSFDPKHDLNLHRKQFGSIKNVILENNVKKVF